MSWIDLLDKAKTRALEVKEIDILRSSFRLLDENNRQLKENNGLLKDKVSTLEREIESTKLQNSNLKKQVEGTPSTSNKYDPNEYEVEILITLAKFDDDHTQSPYPIGVSAIIGMSITQVRHHLDTLWNNEYIKGRQFNTSDEDLRFFLDEKGRQYLVTNNLLASTQ